MWWRTPWWFWLTLAVASLACALQLDAQELRVRFFDVGQGDAALVMSPEGKNALIDGGPNPERIVRYLRALNIDTLDLVVASHNHEDHIRGLRDVLVSTKVRNYMENRIPASSVIHDDVLKAAKLSGATGLAASTRTIRLGSVSLRILPKRPGEQKQNNGSVGILLTYGSLTALFTGDAQDTERRYWMSHDSIPRITVLKVSHHGSSNGTDSLWIATTRPSVAIISVGAGNQYHHPSLATLAILRRNGVQVFRTDKIGTIDLTVSDNGVLSISTGALLGPMTVTRVLQPR